MGAGKTDRYHSYALRADESFRPGNVIQSSLKRHLNKEKINILKEWAP